MSTITDVSPFGASFRPHANQVLRGGDVAALSLAILVWGANWPVMKVGLGHVSPLWFSAMRFATGAACLFAWQAARGQARLPAKADLRFIASIGLLQMTLFTALGACAMTELPAGRSAILSYTTPIWVVPAAALLFRERLERRRLAGVIVAILGVAILLKLLGAAAIVAGVAANAIPSRRVAATREGA